MAQVQPALLTHLQYPRSHISIRNCVSVDQNFEDGSRNRPLSSPVLLDYLRTCMTDIPGGGDV